MAISSVQGRLDVHELLVLTQLPCRVLLGSWQGGLQLRQLGIGVLNGQLPALLSLSDCMLFELFLVFTFDVLCCQTPPPAFAFLGPMCPAAAEGC